MSLKFIRGDKLTVAAKVSQFITSLPLSDSARTKKTVADEAVGLLREIRASKSNDAMALEGKVASIIAKFGDEKTRLEALANVNTAASQKALAASISGKETLLEALKMCCSNTSISPQALQILAEEFARLASPEELLSALMLFVSSPGKPMLRKLEMMMDGASETAPACQKRA
jgi:hypothetical protein